MSLSHKEVAEVLGVSINYDGDPHANCGWDGKSINAKGQSEDTLLHELSHWILCPADRRHVPDFGLGAGPSTNWRAYEDALKKIGKTSRDFDHIKDVDEEILTCTLEFCFGALTGQDMIWLMKDRNFITDFTRHSRHPEKYHWESDNLMIHIKTLQSRGIIDRYWVPKVIKHLVTKDHRKSLTKFRQLVKTIPE